MIGGLCDWRLVNQRGSRYDVGEVGRGLNSL